MNNEAERDTTTEVPELSYVETKPIRCQLHPKTKFFFNRRKCLFGIWLQRDKSLTTGEQVAGMVAGMVAEDQIFKKYYYFIYYTLTAVSPPSSPPVSPLPPPFPHRLSPSAFPQKSTGLPGTPTKRGIASYKKTTTPRLDKATQ